MSKDVTPHTQTHIPQPPPPSHSLSHQQNHACLVEERLFGLLPGKAPISVTQRQAQDICKSADVQRKHQHSQENPTNYCLFLIGSGGGGMLPNASIFLSVKKTT